MATCRRGGRRWGAELFGPLCAVVLIVAVVPIDAVAGTAEAGQPGHEIFSSRASSASSQAAAALPAGFFDERMAGVEATTFQFHTDGRIFLAGKNGQVRLIKNGQLQATPVINIGDHVNRAVDRGLLGLALDKNFTANGYMYLAYTVERHGEPQSTDPRTACITRVTVVGDTASPASEVRILGKDGCGDVDSCTELPVGADCLSVDYTSHGNGAIRVDAEGNLWTTMGDGSVVEPRHCRDPCTRPQLPERQAAPRHPSGQGRAEQSVLERRRERSPLQGLCVRPAEPVPLQCQAGWPDVPRRRRWKPVRRDRRGGTRRQLRMAVLRERRPKSGVPVTSRGAKPSTPPDQRR